MGNVFYREVSKDLQEILPDIKSFSPTNLKYMQYFYELYRSPQVGDSETELKLSPQVGDFEMIIFRIPWGHQKCIIDKCKRNREKALFYVQKVLEDNGCKSKDNVKAQYALEASTQPMGVSEYDISQFMPENFKSSLPTIEEIESELREVMGNEQIG